MASGVFSPDFAMANVARAQQAIADAQNAQAKLSYEQAGKDWQARYVATGGNAGPAPMPPMKKVVNEALMIVDGTEPVSPTVTAPAITFTPSGGAFGSKPPEGYIDPLEKIQHTLDWHSAMLMEIGRLLQR